MRACVVFVCMLCMCACVCFQRPCVNGKNNANCRPGAIETTTTTTTTADTTRKADKGQEKQSERERERARGRQMNEDCKRSSDRLWHCHACSMGLLYSTSANRAKGRGRGDQRGCRGLPACIVSSCRGCITYFMALPGRWWHITRQTMNIDHLSCWKKGLPS